ncbi:hypothetical protein EGW08_019821, partial [Elysia chlorotica]
MAAMTQAGVMSLFQSAGLDSRKLLPATPTPPSADMSSSASLIPPSTSLPTPSLASSPFPMLLSPAHCPLGIPLFSESYLEAMARNAAAAVAMSECGVIPPSPVSMSPLSSPLKKDSGIMTPSATLPNGLGLVGADSGMPSVAGGFLPPHPMMLPRFGFLPPLPLPQIDSKQNLHIPMEDNVMDLSTPKPSRHAEPSDSGLPQDLSAKKSSGSSGTCTVNGHSSSSPLKRTLSPANSSAQIFPYPSHKSAVPRQALSKSPSSLTNSPTPASTGSQDQAVPVTPGKTSPLSSSPQHQNGAIRGSNPKRQRKNTPCPSYSVTSFPKSSAGLVLTRETKSSISSPMFSPKQNTVKDALCSTASSPSPLKSSMSLPIVSSTPGAAGNDSSPTKSSGPLSKSNTTGNNGSQETLPGFPGLFPSSVESSDNGDLEKSQQKNIGSSNLTMSFGAFGKSDKPMDKDLANRVRQLEAHVTQLRNLVIKAEGSKTEGHGRRKPQREFDFNRYNTRHVALKIAYLGWDYQGFVVQEDTDKTVEAALFDALLRTKLIVSRETSNYHRCGRTDKGVSSLGQVISIDLRTNLLSGVGVKVRPGGTAHTRPGDNTTEIRYAHMLNKVLPPEIRVLAWAPVNINFSARFSCKKRVYKYYFPKGNLDIEKMKDAAQKLVGEHDYRNFCKMDVGNGVVNFTRKIFKTDITVLDGLSSASHGYSMCELTVIGQAFLWHQIRCIVAVLFLIGQGKEDVEVVDHLLNVDENPRKPQYNMASEIPLNLFDCEYDEDLEWVYEADWHEENIRHFQQMWAQHTVKATMLKRMLDQLDVAKVET